MVGSERAFVEAERQQAEAATPRGRLMGAYRDFIAVSRCYESRVGRAVTYVTEPELADAKAQVRTVEGTLLREDRSLDKDGLWAEANRTDPASGGDDPLGAVLYAAANAGRLSVEAHEFTPAGKEYCAMAVLSLKGSYEAANPQARALKKDF